MKSKSSVNLLPIDISKESLSNQAGNRWEKERGCQTD